jgi:hypothetical protein
MQLTQPDALDTLEVYVRVYDPSRRLYVVAMLLEGGRSFTDQLRLDDLPPIPTLGGDRDRIRAYGLRLFSTLFTGPLTEVFHQAWAAAQAKQRGLRLRLWLEGDDPIIHETAWELLHYDTSGGNAPPLPLSTSNHILFSRSLSSSEHWGEPIKRRPVRVLVAVSDPNDLETAWPGLVAVGKERYHRELTRILEPMTDSGGIAYEILPHTSVERLTEALNQDPGFDVVLFIGHALQSSTRGIRLMLEDEQSDHGVLYRGEHAISLLRSIKHRPSLVMLIACNTANRSDEAPPQEVEEHIREGNRPLYAASSLAEQMVRQVGIPAVIAMQDFVAVDLAREFTYCVSTELLQHGIIDRAVNAARRHVFQPESGGWSTPVLFMRRQDGRLFAPNSRLEYARAVLNDHRFSQWSGDHSPFIDMEVIPVSAGQDWTILRHHPEDGHPPQDAIEALKEAVRRGERGQCDGLSEAGEAGKTTTTEYCNMVALIGAPRMGQSVLLQRFMFDLAYSLYYPNKAGADLYEFFYRPLAIYVPLDCYKDLTVSAHRLRHLILQSAREMGEMLADILETILLPSSASILPDEQPRYVFVLDGLDMVPDEQRMDAAREIIELVEELPQQQVIVSCAKHLYPSTVFRWNRTLIIQPINERLVVRYLHRRAPANSQMLFRRIVENRLLDMTTNPVLLSLIYDHLTRPDGETLTRNRAVDEYIKQTLAIIPDQYKQGESALKTLVSLAWYAHWNHKSILSTDEVFYVFNRVRKTRDYSLEDLYQAFHNADVLVNVGKRQVRFIHPILDSYCSALALVWAPKHERDKHLHDVLVMCSVPERQEWWEDTLVALVNLLPEPLPFLKSCTHAARVWSGPHILLAARCFAALPEMTIRRMASYLRLELLDASLTGLRSAQEPSPDRRAQIVSSLGTVHYSFSNLASRRDRELAQLLLRIEDELVRILTQRVRWTPGGLRYDYINVRIAAARALRNRYTILGEQLTEIRACRQEGEPFGKQEEPLIEQDKLDLLMWKWSHSLYDRNARDTMRYQLRHVLRTSASPPERAIAAFILGDLAYNQNDASLLLEVIMRPESIFREDDLGWEDTIWAATDALTLFEPSIVAPLITELFRSDVPFPGRSREQLAYVAGRVRLQESSVVGWLTALLLHDPSLTIKAKSLQSLAWISDSLQSPTRIVQALHQHGIEGNETLIPAIFQAIALWDRDYLDKIGFVIGKGEESHSTVQYIRRKAIEGLAWVGTEDTIKILRRHVVGWSFELRSEWYETAAAIEARLERS